MAQTIEQEPKPINYAEKPIWLVISSDLMTGTPPDLEPSEENLQAYVEVWEVGSGGDELRVALNAPYDSADGKAYFNLQELFSVKTHLPEPVTIDVGAVPSPFIDFESRRIFYFKHAEKYGTPAVPEALTQSGNYVVIKGSIPFDAILDIEQKPATIGPLHTYYSKVNSLGSATKLTKPIHADQPDWIYGFVGKTATYEMKVDIYYDDGTTTTHLITAQNYDEDDVFYLTSGPVQLDLDGLASGAGATGSIVGYSVQFWEAGQPAAAFSVEYTLKQACQDWGFYILAFNGVGGCESVAMFGKNTHRHQAETGLFERLRWIDATPDEGLMDTYNPQGFRVFEAHSGYIPREYAEHLRVLLSTELWLIDTHKKKFHKIIPLSTSMNVAKDDEDLFSVTMQFRAGWSDRYFNVL